MKYLNRKMQQGGAAPQQGIEQQVMQALKQGVKPEQVLQALVKQGIPQDQATAMIQGILQQMQQGAQSAKDGAKLEMIGRLQKGKKIVPKTTPNDATDYVIPTKNEGGTDMNPKDWKPGVSNTASKDKNIPSDDKELIPVKKPIKKEQGGYLKSAPKGEKQKDIAYAKPPKNTFKKGGKSKKCANGCGCKPKLAMHKDGGKLIEVCSCCGAMCN